MPKLFAFLLVLLNWVTPVSAAYPQRESELLNRRVTLQAEKSSLRDVLRQLSQQVNVRFSYNSRQLPVDNQVNMVAVNEALGSVLDRLLAPYYIGYIVHAQLIVLSPKLSSATSIDNKPASAAVSQQDIVVTGRVTDETNAGLPGVNIVLKGTNRGTATEIDGTYRLTVPDGSQTLVFSLVGYATQEVVVGNRSILDLQLKPDTKNLSEVVVIGYGTQRKRDVTGAVTSVKAEDMDVSVASNFAQSLQGRATGIQVIQSTGQPGASVDIKIRSNPSNANPGTLYVIDGIIVNNNPGTPSAGKYTSGGVSQSPLNFINPNDIESIEILKDASSRAIYGAQAGGGVVLVTTKRGKTGKPTLQYSGSYAIQQADRMYQVLGTKDYMTQRNLIAQETYLYKNKVAPYYGAVDASTVTPFKPVFTQQQIDEAMVQPNAMEAIIRQGYTQQHDISLSASTGKTSYFISGNYFDQQGVLLGTGYKRFNAKINLDQTLSDKIKVGINVMGSNGRSLNAVTGGQFENGGIVTAAMYYPANLPLQLPDGTYPLNPSYSSIPNPISFTTITDELQNQRLLTTAYGTWEVIKGLTARASFSYDQGTAKRTNFLPTTFSYGAQVNGIARIGNNYSTTQQIDYTLNYKVPIGQHQSIDALAGYTYQLQNAGAVLAGNQNFTSDAISYYSLGTGQADKPTVGSSQSQVSYASYFARAIYQLNGKYTIQASVRRDGSSRFSANHKWGIFPAVSAGWIISDETFLKTNNLVNLLKLRVGYGEIGNANFPASAFEVYGPGISPIFGTNSSSTGIFLTQAANPDLKWETAGELNAGVDFALFQNRITGSFDYFTKTIRDLITYIPYPADFIVRGVYGNAGTTKSTGFEIGLQTRNVTAAQNGGFTWSSTLNFSHYLSYWSQRSPQALATLARYVAPSGKDALFSGVYGYQASGELFRGKSGEAPAHMPNILPGGIILNDIQGYDASGNLTGPDGRITSADQTLLGNADPKFNIGFGNSFSFKNLDLNIFLSGIVQKAFSPYAGNGIYRFAQLDANMGTYGWNTITTSLDRWTFQNPTANVPSGVSDPVYAGFQNNSSYYFVDASFLRAQNITLGYTLPSTLLDRQKTISRLRLSFDVQNAFILTSYPIVDPQVDQRNFYPLPRSFVFGLSANF